MQKDFNKMYFENYRIYENILETFLCKMKQTLIGFLVTLAIINKNVRGNQVWEWYLKKKRKEVSVWLGRPVDLTTNLGRPRFDSHQRHNIEMN